MSDQRSRVFCWHPVGEGTGHRHKPDDGCPTTAVASASFNLCSECGCVTWADDWRSENYGEDADSRVPAPPGNEGAFYICPACEHPHQDNDTSCVWGGSLEEMKAERESNAADFGWDDDE